jgi:signal transduction histidine kinase
MGLVGTEVVAMLVRPLRLLLDAVPLVLFTIDPSGIITCAVGSGLPPIGRWSEEQVGHSYREVYGAVPWMLDAVERGLRREVVRVVAPLGEVWLDVQLAPVRGADDRFEGLVGLAIDVTERHRSESLLRAAIDSTADGILVIDRSSRVSLYNNRFVEMWNIPGRLLEPRDDVALLQFVVDQLQDPDEFLARVHDLYANPETESFDVIRFKDDRYFERLSRPQRIGARVVGRVWSFRDVTQRRHGEEALRRAVRVRDEFLSIASHELYTPIHSLLLALQVVTPDRTRAPASREQFDRMLAVATRQVRRLSQLVGSLLDVTRIDTSRLDLVREPVDLGGLVTDIMEQFAADLARTGSSLAQNITPGVVGSWDRSRLEQVVTNLISNAIKFGNGKPIVVTVTRTGARAVLEIQDHGVGIAPDQLEAVFERFVRAVSARHFGGLGLGLYVCRKIVEAHGGTIDVTSGPSQGSTFTVRLPLDEGRAHS